MVPLLLGGLLKGETLGLARLGISAAGWLGCEKRENRAAPISGFSARLTGGGTGLLPSLGSRSRLNSPDRLGGGGDGGLEGVRRGDRRGSAFGVRGRLGILNCFVAVDGDEGLTRESVFTKAGRSPVGTPPVPLFGGECGGSTVSDGGCAGRGVMGGGRGRVGDVERPTLAAEGGMLEMVSRLGRVGGTGGGSRAAEGLAAEGLASRSRSRPGFGAGAGAGGTGDAVREELPVWGGLSFLFRFSNLASSEDTGLWQQPTVSFTVPGAARLWAGR